MATGGGGGYVGWMVTNKSGGRQAEGDEAKEKMVKDVGRSSAILQSRKQDSAHPLPRASGERRQEANTCAKNKGCESF